MHNHTHGSCDGKDHAGNQFVRPRHAPSTLAESVILGCLCIVIIWAMVQMGELKAQQKPRPSASASVLK